MASMPDLNSTRSLLRITSLLVVTAALSRVPSSYQVALASSSSRGPNITELGRGAVLVARSTMIRSQACALARAFKLSLHGWPASPLRSASTRQFAAVNQKQAGRLRQLQALVHSKRTRSLTMPKPQVQGVVFGGSQLVPCHICNTEEEEWRHARLTLLTISLPRWFLVLHASSASAACSRSACHQHADTGWHAQR